MHCNACLSVILTLTVVMLPSHLNWDDKDDDLEEFCMEILRFNLDNSPGIFFDIIFFDIIDEKHYKYILDEYNLNKIKKKQDTILVSNSATLLWDNCFLILRSSYPNHTLPGNFNVDLDYLIRCSYNWWRTQRNSIYSTLTTPILLD